MATPKSTCTLQSAQAGKLALYKSRLLKHCAYIKSHPSCFAIYSSNYIYNRLELYNALIQVEVELLSAVRSVGLSEQSFGPASLASGHSPYRDPRYKRCASGARLGGRSGAGSRMCSELRRLFFRTTCLIRKHRYGTGKACMGLDHVSRGKCIASMSSLWRV